MSLTNRNRGPTGLTAVPLMTALICTAALMATGAAQAQKSVHVSYVASDLTRPEAALVLYQRIQRAARVACNGADIRDLTAYTVFKQCFDRAVDEAVAKVDATVLTAVHRSKTQRNAPG
jgi:UrcA family protein